MKQKAINSEFLKFILSGGFAALVNILLRYALTPLVGYSISIVIAYIIAMTTAWSLARLFVFSSSSTTLVSEYTRFGLVNMVALLQVWGLSIGLDEYLFPAIRLTYHPDTIAHIIGVFSPVIPSYLGHKFFTFRKNGYINKKR